MLKTVVDDSTIGAFGGGGFDCGIAVRVGIDAERRIQLTVHRNLVLAIAAKNDCRLLSP